MHHAADTRERARLAAAQSAGGLYLYAAAAAWRGRVALLIGPSRAGKSTLVGLWLRAGWEFVADDGVVLAPLPSPMIVAGEDTLKLRSPARALLQVTQDPAVGVGDDEALPDDKVRVLPDALGAAPARLPLPVGCVVYVGESEASSQDAWLTLLKSCAADPAAAPVADAGAQRGHTQFFEALRLEGAVALARLPRAFVKPGDQTAEERVRRLLEARS